MRAGARTLHANRGGNRLRGRDAEPPHPRAHNNTSLDGPRFLSFSRMNPMHREGFRCCENSTPSQRRDGASVSVGVRTVPTLGRVTFPSHFSARGACGSSAESSESLARRSKINSGERARKRAAAGWAGTPRRARSSVVSRRCGFYRRSCSPNARAMTICGARPAFRAVEQVRRAHSVEAVARRPA